MRRLAAENEGRIDSVKAAPMPQSRKDAPRRRPAVDEGDRQAEELLLLRQYTHRLVKQSLDPNCPHISYICQICSVDSNNIQEAEVHIRGKRHQKNFTVAEKQREENELRALQPPSAAQLKAVDATVRETAAQQGISEEDLGVRRTVVSRMEEIINRHLPACSLHLYGSSLTGFALKSSDINIDVTFPSTMTQPEVLTKVMEIFKNGVEFSDVKTDFHADFLAVFCRDKSSGLLCTVSAGNSVACLTTNYLAALAKKEPRLVPLVLAFRYWARLCHIDCQAEGGIPSYCFALMVIFFLQQRKEPILPVYLGHWVEGFDVKHVDEYRLTDIVLDMFVKWEHRPPSSTEGRGKNWSDVKGEGSPKPEQKKPEGHMSEGLSNLTNSRDTEVSLGQLWMELFRFYTLEFALEENIISIRLTELLSRQAKNWPRRRLSIEDPFSLTRNVSRSLNSQMMFESIRERFRSAYKYFACPQKRGAASHQRNERVEAGRKEEQSAVDESFTADDLHYVFDRMIFTGGKPPIVVCSICKRDGHLKVTCPEDFKKIELEPLPPMNERFREILDGVCKIYYDKLSPSPVDQQKREQILVGLEGFIRKEYNEKAQLCLFGSSKNGFGFRDSDLDICMTLEGHDSAEEMNCREVIEGLANALEKHTDLGNILPVTTARVPIVKFEHRPSGLEADISFHNTLAQHNTRMLATYAALDPRVQLLGYTMKVFAKRCNIHDASKGRLSSYACILMVLYFLQQRQPPVIPVLQEIFDGSTVPQRMVEGWNTFFFDDIPDLRQRLAGHQPNMESVGELWLGLLRFYTEDFNFKEHVISIRQRKLLTKFEKLWMKNFIAIEDPFQLNRNIAAIVSREMTEFIIRAFIKGRKLFGTPFYPLPGTEEDHFFKVLTDDEPPLNDYCKTCGKIGHKVKNCAKKRKL
ncbi:hypothetical protein OJAV_G00035590 [Oryzias javanicus]|uniref:RNA uridylyltransferase n=1 Tax=Oryzias javanicus TaxID=123683 RepID=A0A437DGL2_ORYJA|nr:hypothetical protein OJAV_G00035590 [Oryzias javanicus]